MHKFKYILEATAQLRWFKCSRLLFNKHQIQRVFFSALSGVLLFDIAQKADLCQRAEVISQRLMRARLSAQTKQ